ncbi:MAG: inositol monophosphatase family protein [Pseudomonadota bacterium]
MMQSALYKVISQSVEKALRPLGRDIREIEKLQVSRKGPGDFVTGADTRTERIIKEGLSKARPAFGFIAEEGENSVGSDKDHNWIIDPIDGTTNFMHGIPHFGISVALQHKDEIIAGYIFDPAKGEEFFAEKGKGAFLNGDRLRVSGRTDLSECLIGTGLPFIGCEGHDRTEREISSIMPKTAGIRRMGAASLDLAYVAAGRYDAYWEHNLKVWDIAAGILIVKEAGGSITTTSGNQDMLKTGDILASNQHIHSDIQKLLAAA